MSRSLKKGPFVDTPLLEKIEGMNQDDAARIRQASALPVICVGGWQTAGRIREALGAGRAAGQRPEAVSQQFAADLSACAERHAVCRYGGLSRTISDADHAVARPGR